MHKTCQCKGDAPYNTCNNAEKYKAAFKELRVTCERTTQREALDDSVTPHIRGTDYFKCEPTLTFGAFCVHHLRYHVQKPSVGLNDILHVTTSQKTMKSSFLEDSLVLDVIHAPIKQGKQHQPAQLRKRKRKSSAPSVSLPHLTKQQFTTYMRLLCNSDNVPLNTVLGNRQELQDFAVQCVCARYIRKCANAKERTQELTKILPSYTLKQLQEFVVASDVDALNRQLK
jgi:hypothetical protein